MNISVIIPARNEEERILENLRVIENTMIKLQYDYEILIIDDCSSDDMFLRVLENDDIKIYRKVVQQGKGAAIKTGLKMAKGEYVVVMDADAQIRVEEIETFFKVMDLYNSDVVIANKRHAFSNVDYSSLRWIISNTYNLLIRVLFGIQLRDTQAGLKLFKKKSLDLVMDKITVKGFAFDLELIVALKENNIRIADAPVYVSKSVGTGSVSLKTISRTFFDTIDVWIKKQKGYYK